MGMSKVASALAPRLQPLALGAFPQGAASRAVRRLLMGLASAILAFICGTSARAEYVLATGDSIEIAAIGVPDIRSRAVVDIDGRALFPLLGPIKAAGLTISEVQANVRELLPTKVFRRRTEDGREYPVVLTPDDVLVSIAEYRPVYVNGDVAKPGAQPYRPGLTVRQAIVLAGGFDVMRFRAKDPFLEAADLKGDYDSLWIEFARQQARIWRLHRELGDPVDSSKQEPTPVPESTVSNIKKVENDMLTANDSDYQMQKQHLSAVTKQEEERIRVLKAELEKEREDADADAADFQQTRANLQKGIVPTTRVAESRRLTLYSATRALETTALIAQLERERMDLSTQLARLDGERRIRLLDELQDSSVKLADTRAKLQAVGEKVVYAGVVRSQLVRGEGDHPDLVLHRDDSSHSVIMGADENAELMPGDVIEVRVRAEERPPK